MGRIVPLDPPEETPITGYEFWDDEDDSLFVVATKNSGELAEITYCGNRIDITRDGACKLIRALEKIIELMPSDEDC